MYFHGTFITSLLKSMCNVVKIINRDSFEIKQLNDITYLCCFFDCNLIFLVLYNCFAILIVSLKNIKQKEYNFSF